MKLIQSIYLLVGILALSFIACQSPTAQVSNTKASIESEAPKAVKASLENTIHGGLHVGDKATDFNLKGTDEKMHSLNSIENAKGYIVTFTCNHCPYAVMYEDRLIALHNEYAAKGYPVIAINPNDPAAQPEDSFDNMKKRGSKKEFPFLYLFDEGQKVYPKYGATRTPHVFLLDKDLIVKYIGAIDDNARDASAVKTKYLENALQSLMNGSDPDPDFTKAIGCSIKKV